MKNGEGGVVRSGIENTEEELYSKEKKLCKERTGPSNMVIKPKFRENMAVIYSLRQCMINKFREQFPILCYIFFNTNPLQIFNIM